jgi:hypothetical protein
MKAVDIYREWYKEWLAPAAIAKLNQEVEAEGLVTDTHP